MGAIATLVGFIIVFPCFCIGAAKVIKTIFGWRKAAKMMQDATVVYVDQNGNPIP